MISQVLHSVQDCEKEAEQIIEQAKEEALRIKSQAKDEISENKFRNLNALADESDKRKASVKEEQDRQDKEFELKIHEELEVLVKDASEKEEKVIEQLSQQIYAL